MHPVATVDEMVGVIEHAVCSGLDALIRTDGAVQPPMVHMFSEGRAQPYIGCVTCRPFHAGDDAARAIAKLGELPGTVQATRLLVTWEAQDLNVALGLPMDRDGSALIVVDATLRGQELRWYPLGLSRAREGHPALIPEWGAPVSLSDPPLPEPITRLLVLWRLARGGDLDWTVGRLESDGYRIGWYPH